jgi:hypothetical protein
MALLSSWTVLALVLAGFGILAVQASHARQSAQAEAARARRNELKARLLAVEGRRQANDSCERALEAARRFDLSDQERRRGALRLADSLVALGDALALSDQWREAYERGYRQAERLYRDLGSSSDSLARGVAQIYLHQPPPLIRYQGPSEGVSALGFSPDGSQVASGSDDGYLAVWEAWTGRRIRLLLAGRKVLCLAFDRDGRRLAAGTLDGSFAVWELSSGCRLWSRNLKGGPARSLSFSNDDSKLFVAGQTGDLVLAAADTGELLHSWSLEAEVSWAGFLKTDQGLIWGGADGVGHRLDLGTGESSAGCGGVFPVGSRVLCALCPGGRWVLSDTQVIDLGTGENVGSFLAGGSLREDASFSSDGTRAVSVNQERGLSVWDTETGRELRSYVWHSEGAQRAIFSPDGRFVLSGGTRGTLHLWEAILPGMEASLAHRYGEYEARLAAPQGTASDSPEEGPNLRDLSRWWDFRGFPDLSSRLEAWAEAEEKMFSRPEDRVRKHRSKEGPDE